MTRTLARVPFGTPSDEALSLIRASKQAHAAEHATAAYAARYRELQAAFEVKLAELRAEYLAELAAIAEE